MYKPCCTCRSDSFDILFLDYKTDQCPTILPVIAPDTITAFPDNWPAEAALVDGVTEGNLPGWEGQGDRMKNIWAGAVNTAAVLVIDLGCAKTIAKIELRNTDNIYDYG